MPEMNSYSYIFLPEYTVCITSLLPPPLSVSAQRDLISCLINTKVLFVLLLLPDLLRAMNSFNELLLPPLSCITVHTKTSSQD